MDQVAVDQLNASVGATVVRLQPSTERILSRYGASASPSARVLLTTIFGDSLLPRGHPVPVQALAALALPFGINERGVRTALQRLSNEQIVQARRVGRRSFYRVHPSAVATFEHANRRIYERVEADWDGEWTIAVLGVDDTTPPGSGPTGTGPAGTGADTVAELARRLQWLGMAPVAPGVLVSATLPPDRVAALVEAEGGGSGLTAVTRGPLRAGTLADDAGRRRLVDPDGALDRLHRQHLETFRPVPLDRPTPPTDSFVLRTLVVDSWRRIALRTTDVPPALEPSDWLAAPAFELTMAVLHAVRPASDAHLDEILTDAVEPADG